MSDQVYLLLAAVLPCASAASVRLVFRASVRLVVAFPAITLVPVPRKYFTLAEANRTLPLVKRIVTDLIALHPQWRDLVAQYELVAAQARPEWGESTEQLALRGRIDDIARQINDFLSELEQIGCLFKGFDPGLVDFYGKLDGKEMFWCWKVGEERIEHWHELDTGFSGRQPIPVTVGGQG